MHQEKGKRKYSVLWVVLIFLLLVEITVAFYINLRTSHHKEYEKQLSLGESGAPMQIMQKYFL